MVRPARRLWIRWLPHRCEVDGGISGRLPRHHRLPHRHGRHWDASARIESTAANCPNTNIVLGGFFQGAAVAGFVTANIIPDGAPEGVPNPMPPDVAKNVAAVALFGKPNQRFMRAINQPEVDVGPLYADKTVELCVPDDFVCSSGRDFNAHTQYAETGMVDEAATFAAAV